MVITYKLGECLRLSDVIEKTQAELNMAKAQLSQIQRAESQLRSDFDSIRNISDNKEKRTKEQQVFIRFL